MLLMFNRCPGFTLYFFCSQMSILNMWVLGSINLEWYCFKQSLKANFKRNEVKKKKKKKDPIWCDKIQKLLIPCNLESPIILAKNAQKIKSKKIYKFGPICGPNPPNRWILPAPTDDSTQRVRPIYRLSAGQFSSVPTQSS